MRASKSLPASNSKVISITTGARRIDVQKQRELTEIFDDALDALAHVRKHLGPEVYRAMKAARPNL